MQVSFKTYAIFVAMFVWSCWFFLTMQPLVRDRQLLVAAATYLPISTANISSAKSFENISNTRVIEQTTKRFVTKNRSKIFSDCLKSALKFNRNDFVIQPEKCSDNVDLVWLIKSSIFRNSLRKFNRQSWGRDSFTIPLQQNNIKVIKRIFLVGSDEQNDTVPILVKESEKYKDILQGEFADTFSSATYKVVMGMKFVKEFCSSAKYVIVADDDASVLTWNLFSILPRVEKGEHLYAGFFTSGAVPIRDDKHKWFMSAENFACNVYPTYAMGALYILSSKSASSLFDEAMTVNYLPMDDIFVGGIAQNLKLIFTHLSFDNYAYECGQFLKGHTSILSSKYLAVCHGAETVDEQKTIWNEFCYSSTKNEEKSKTLLNYCGEVY